MNIDGKLVDGVVHLYKDLELFGDGPKARELSNIIKEHALLGTAAGLIPIPGVDLAALAANTWTMYARINSAVGVSFGDHVLKSIASGVIANLASLIPGVALAIGAEEILKLTGIGTLGGMALGAAADVAVVYTAGRVYLKSLEMLIHSARPLTEENLKLVTQQTSEDKAFVKGAYTEGKKVAKNR